VGEGGVVMSRNFLDAADAPGGSYLLTNPGEFADHMRAHGPRRLTGRTYDVVFYVDGVPQPNPLHTYALTEASAVNRATLAAEQRADLTGREHTFTVAVAA
jgi:hypothetical protein